MWHAGDGMGWWMLFGWLWFLLFWGIIVWVVWRVATPEGRARSEEASALEIAKRRYARGEIDEREFEQRRRALL